MNRPGPVLVIGYGNPLRGDDAAGECVVQEVQRRRSRGVETLLVHQLTPELAARLAEARAVVFVDASQADEPVALRRLEPAAATVAAPAHGSSPAALLSLTRFAFGHAPPGWLLTIPATDFAFGAALSPRARRGVEAALRLLESWLETVETADWTSARRQ